MKKVAFIFFVSVFFISPSVSNAYEFTRNLSVGARGDDVVELQKVLNRHPDTEILGNAGGSPGKETPNFGALTKNAVIRFQNKYKNDILTPSGLSAGTGFVGEATRRKLSQLSLISGPTSSIEPSKPATNPPSPLVFAPNYKAQPQEKIDIYQKDKVFENFQDSISNEVNLALSQKRAPNLSMINTFNPASAGNVAIVRINVYEGTPGTQITITGTDFRPENELYFDNGVDQYIIRNIKPKLGAISVVVPSIPAGRYDVAVKNQGGVSNTSFFIVKGTQNPRVAISSIVPQKVSYGDTITISGSGFSATNNEIRTTYAKMKGVPSADGKTLTVAYKPEMFREMTKFPKENKELLIEVFVINDNGFTPTPTTFTFTF
jgi:hypothetical protein